MMLNNLKLRALNATNFDFTLVLDKDTIFLKTTKS